MKSKPMLVIFVTVFIDLAGFGMIIPLSPFLARDFGADALGVGLLMAIYSLMQFLIAPVWGHISDRIGRRPVILISLLGAGFSHLLFGFGGSLVTLFVARGLAGLFGANIATAMAYIADITEEKDRAKGMGLIGAAFGLGFVLGPFLGGVAGHLGSQLGDSAPFGPSFAAIIAGLVCLTNFVMAFYVLPETVSKSDGAFRQKKAKRLQTMLRYCAHPNLGALLIAYFLCTLGLANIEAPLFLFVEDVFQWTQMQASFGFAYIGLIMVFTQGYLIRKIIPKLGEKTAMTMGLLVYMAGMIGVALSFNLTTFAIAVTLIGLGNGLSNPSITGSISLLAPKDQQGAVLGVNQSLSALGRIIGPISGGWLYREMGGGATFTSAGLLILFAFVLVFVVRHRLPDTAHS